MSIIINGVELTDTADWWGWRQTPNGAVGNVAPGSRADFFEELKLGNQAVRAAGSQAYTHALTKHRHTYYTRGGTFVIDTATRQIVAGHSIPRWTYGGDSTAMSLYICCVSRGRVAAADGPALGVACSNSSADAASGVPGWTVEERVEITSAAAVAVGDTIIAATASRGAEGSFERQVYDEQGNTWTLDAQYAHDGDEYRAMIWRCNVTNAISAGDYIRFAHKSGGGAGIDTSSRCIGAYRFTGTLSVASIGSGASAFSSTPALTTPAGDVVVATVALEEDDPGTGLTLDPDWNVLAPFTLVTSGASSGTEGIGSQFLTNAAASTWSATIDQTRVWAAISVGYTRT